MKGCALYENFKVCHSSNNTPHISSEALHVSHLIWLQVLVVHNLSGPNTLSITPDAFRGIHCFSPSLSSKHEKATIEPESTKLMGFQQLEHSKGVGRSFEDTILELIHTSCPGILEDDVLANDSYRVKHTQGPTQEQRIAEASQYGKRKIRNRLEYNPVFAHLQCYCIFQYAEFGSW